MFNIVMLEEDFEKSRRIKGDIDYSKLNSKEEFELVKTLEGFNKSILQAIEN